MRSCVRIDSRGKMRAAKKKKKSNNNNKTNKKKETSTKVKTCIRKNSH